MKKLISVLFLSLFFSHAHAGSVLDDVVFGVSLIRQDVNLQINSPGSKVSLNESATGFGVYVDKYYKKKYRFNSTLNYVAYDLFDLVGLTVSADYLVPLNQEVSFFAGLSGGAGMQKYNDVSISDASFGLVYGAEIGAIAYVNSNLMIESGYRKKLSNIKTEVKSASDMEAELEEINEFYFNFLLMF